MKQITRLITLVVVTGIAVLFSCQKKQNPSYKDSGGERPELVSRLAPDTNADAKAAWYPPGTKFTDNGKGYTARAPKGWGYMGTTIGGEGFFLRNNITTSVTCACNMGIGTCKPFEATGPWGTTRGCIGTCSNCTMSISSSQYHVANGGYFSPSAQPRLLRTGESAPALFEQLAALPEFQQSLQQFLREAYGNAPFQSPVVKGEAVTAPEGYVLAAVSIMGRGLAVVLPEEFAKRELGYTFKTKATCKCSNNTGKCTLKEKKFLGVGSIWCEGTCNGCTLTTDTELSASGETYEVNIFSVAL